MLSERKWSHLGVARLFLGVMATMCFGLGLGGLAQNLVPGSEEQKHFAGMVVTAISFQGAAFWWIILFLRGENLTWSQAFGFKSEGRNHAMMIGLLAGVLIVPVAVGLELLSDTVMQFFHATPEVQAMVKTLQQHDLGLGPRILLGVLAVAVAPVTEEILFRGILYPTVKQMGHPRLALWGTSVLFGIIHFSMVTLLPLVLLAVFLVILYEHTDNLLAPILAHAAFNATNFVMVHYQT